MYCYKIKAVIRDELQLSIIIFTGIKHVLVALMAQKAEIKYDPEYILSNQIANRVNDLGFHATVMESESLGKGTVELLVS